jgi:glycyl-tRNA synthetase beta chain
VVGEFPELQGVMGRHYATADGEHADVCRAIDEHYQPRFAGDAIPTTREGTVVSLADKLDSITGAFALGLEPSGSQDPYALRRQAIGVLRLLLQDGVGQGPHAPVPLDLDVRELVGLAADALGPAIVKDRAALVDKVTDFLLGRLRVKLQDDGHDTNLIGATLGTGSGNPADLLRRLTALEAIAGSAEFAPMMIAFKRVMNISKDHAASAYQRGLFEAAEHALADAFERMVVVFDGAMEERDYDRALSSIVGLKPAIDAFFDSVLVMADDPVVRANRLGLVRAVADRFRRFADFARVQF